MKARFGYVDRSTRLQLLGAAVVAIAVRACFVWQFPFYESGDTPLYDELARNWLAHGVYGMQVDGQLTPVDIRMPGYPAFLAAVYALFGTSPTAVMAVQAAIDLLTCALIGALAATAAGARDRRRVVFAALWLAATCPFIANYAAVVLTEVAATFLTAFALLSLASEAESPTAGGKLFAAGLAAGFGALFRPETPIVLLAAGVPLGLRHARQLQWGELLRAGAIMALGLFLPLSPWAARNWVTLHEARLLVPRFSELPQEYAPRGFYAWTATWLWRFRDVEPVPWKVDGEPIQVDEISTAAFDSADQRARVVELVGRYNVTKTMTPAVDDGFAEIARQRTSRHPLRTYMLVPVGRALSLWLAPRVEMLPASGVLWPIGGTPDDGAEGYATTVSFALLGVLYLCAGAAGGWLARAQPAAQLLVAFLVVRTVFLTTALTPEPRYVLECYPALLALAAQLWGRRPGSDA